MNVIVLLPFIGLLVLGGLAFTISMLIHPKTRPWGIALLAAGPILLLLIAVGLYPTARYQAPKYYDATWDIRRPIAQIRQDKPVAMKAEDAKALIDIVEKDIVSQYQPQARQPTSTYRFGSQVVRSVLLPLPQVLPDIPAVESMQKKIAALESALKDIKQVLAKTME